MACQVTLPIWPTTLNCLSWSHDNSIAVAGGDQIAILTPRLRELGPNGTHWDSTLILRANAFTAEEVHRADPLSFKNFSAGEELSQRHIEALEWSSPGLAKYGRCALAVLSSNHVLSLWECDGKADVSANWKRSLIINHAIQGYYGFNGSRSNETEAEQRELLQLSQRIRCFAWSKPLETQFWDETGGWAPYTMHGTQYLAISTEHGDILILRIWSPYNILDSKSRKWTVEIVHCYQRGTNASQQLEPGVASEKSQGQSKDHHFSIADHIAWGPWRYNQKRICCAYLVFVESGRLQVLEVASDVLNSSATHRSIAGWSAEVISANQTETVIGKLPNAGFTDRTESQRLMLSQSDITGPLKFAHDTDLLIAFSAEEVLCVDTSSQTTRASIHTVHHLDDRWDEVSGVAFSYDHAGPPNVHITSHISSSAANTTVLSLPFKDEEVSTMPAWQTAINESKAAFSAHHNLEGQVQERVWGIASSPMGGEYIATATTILPSDSISYITASDQRTVINITFEANDEQNNALLIQEGNGHHPDITAEVVLFSLQRYKDRHPEFFDAETLEQALLKAFGVVNQESSTEADGAQPSAASDAAIMVGYLKAQVMGRSEIIREKIKILVNMALGQVPTGKQVSLPVIRCLVTAIARTRTLVKEGGELSDKIRYIYSTLRSKLQLDALAFDLGLDIMASSEQCRICHEIILFESVKWAKCKSGHQFSRCALTFLAIQEPDLSKHCAVCRKPYLNEWKVTEFRGSNKDEDVEKNDLNIENGQTSWRSTTGQAESEINAAEHHVVGNQDPTVADAQVLHDEPSIEPPLSLARILFAACDTCIYCGGKYIA